MTRKDYQLIAQTISRLPLTEAQLETVAEDFAYALRNTNPLFNTDKFLKACRS